MATRPLTSTAPRKRPALGALPQARARLRPSRGPRELTKKGIRPAALSLCTASCRAHALMANLSSEGMAFSFTPPISPALSTEEWACNGSAG